uniref:Uncharacterized protein n=1 Tax=Solanum lycopersicum TaxID=4081 RepID=A0A3Q7ECA0_SOLLC
SQIFIDTFIISSSESYGDSYIYRAISSGQSLNSIENEGSSRRTHTKDSDLTIRECSNDLEMSSSDRIELLINPGTWDSIDEDMVSLDSIEFHSEEEPYKDRIDSYQRKT